MSRDAACLGAIATPGNPHLLSPLCCLTAPPPHPVTSLHLAFVPQQAKGDGVGDLEGDLRALEGGPAELKIYTGVRFVGRLGGTDAQDAKGQAGTRAGDEALQWPISRAGLRLHLQDSAIAVAGWLALPCKQME